MSSLDGASDRSCTLECDQETENNDKIVVKVEMQEPGRRGSATTPVDLGAVTKSGAKPANNRPVSSIESDEVCEPVTPKKSSVNGAGRGRGQGRKKAISKKLRGVKVSTDKVLKTRQSFSKSLETVSLLTSTPVPTIIVVLPSDKATFVVLALTFLQRIQRRV